MSAQYSATVVPVFFLLLLLRRFGNNEPVNPSNQHRAKKETFDVYKENRLVVISLRCMSSTKAFQTL